MSVSENREKMIVELSGIWNDVDFIAGVDVHLKTEAAVNKMLDFLDENKEINLNSDQVLKKALEIRYNREITI